MDSVGDIAPVVATLERIAAEGLVREDRHAGVVGQTLQLLPKKAPGPGRLPAVGVDRDERRDRAGAASAHGTTKPVSGFSKILAWSHVVAVLG